MANASIRYGRRIRKAVAVIKKNKISHYKCEMCGKISVGRIGTSIWKCKHCKTTYAGGAYSMTTSVGESAKQQIKELGKTNRNVVK